MSGLTGWRRKGWLCGLLPSIGALGARCRAGAHSRAARSGRMADAVRGRAEARPADLAEIFRLPEAPGTP